MDVRTAASMCAELAPQQEAVSVTHVGLASLYASVACVSCGRQFEVKMKRATVRSPLSGRLLSGVRLILQKCGQAVVVCTKQLAQITLVIDCLQFRSTMTTH